MFIRNECTDVTKYEFPTLEMLREFAIRNPEYYILYLHTKGVSRNIDSVKDWRACMLYFMVEKYLTCVNQLLKFQTCGINYMIGPMPHYQGNFWWARADYISTLCPVRNTPDISHLKDTGNGFSERHKAEMWLMTGNPRVSNIYHHKLNPYIKCNPPKNYKYELLQRRERLPEP